jgi:hypothetical protein
VLGAEFIVFDPDDPRTDSVEIGLRGLAFLLIAGTLFTVGAIGSRALLAIPIVLLVGAAISWRLLRLTYQDVSLGWPFLIGIFSAQVANSLEMVNPTSSRQVIINTHAGVAERQTR